MTVLMMDFNGGHYRTVVLIRVPATFGQWSKGRMKHDPLTDSELLLSLGTRARTKCLNCNEIRQEIYVSASLEDPRFRCAKTSAVEGVVTQPDIQKSMCANC